jgi:hypothetical protein
MVITMMRALAIGLVLAVGACEEPAPDVPRRVCARMGVDMTVVTCVAWRLECIQPLALSTAEDGRLVCRQREGGF